MGQAHNSCKGQHLILDREVYHVRFVALLIVLMMSTIASAMAVQKGMTQPDSSASHSHFATEPDTSLSPTAIARQTPVAQKGMRQTDSSASQRHITTEPEKSISLPAIARQTLAAHFGHADKQYSSIKEFADSFPVPQRYKKSAGIFVTFSRKGKTRACWGSIYPQYPDLVKGTVYATEAALTKDYRFKKIRESEVSFLKPQVTIIKSIQPISSLTGQNPLAYGLFVRSGGRTAVFLPGEASDAYYQMIQCKLKAGINPGQPCQMYRIKADVLN